MSTGNSNDGSQGTGMEVRTTLSVRGERVGPQSRLRPPRPQKAPEPESPSSLPGTQQRDSGVQSLCVVLPHSLQAPGLP